MKVHAILRQHSNWGEARISSVSEDGATATLDYFTQPGVESRRIEALAVDLLPPLYEKGQRVYFYDESGALRSGRLADQGLHSAGNVAIEYPGPVASGQVLLIDATGGRRFSLPPELVEVCSELEIGDPTSVLAATSNEGSWWFHSRAGLVRALARERSVFRGLTGLASSTIDICEHQVEVARRVLGDPVSRYILADEVGLGKTIEAGIVIRQHILESDADFKVLVVVPQHLIGQWTVQLSDKFGLGEELALGSIEICTTAGVRSIVADVWEGEYPEVLVVDEAHHLAGMAFSGAERDKLEFATLGEVSEAASRVLLLSATPALRDKAGFLAMLHLMDRAAYRLDDLEGFSRKIEARQAVAEVSFLLSQPVLRLLRQGLLARLQPIIEGDETGKSLASALADAWAADDADRASISQRNLHGHIRSAHQVYRRLIRTRRDAPSVVGALPRREFSIVEVESEFHELAGEFLDDWRLADLAGILASEQREFLSRLFSGWVASSLEGPAGFLEELRGRLASLQGGADPAFDGEEALLSDYLPRLERLGVEVGGHLSEILKSQDRTSRRVVFLSDERLCEEVCSQLGRRAAVVDGAVPDHEVLLIPQAGEEGLNLQRVKGDLVHADLPLSTVRIEQRIGRMDRLNAANMTVNSKVVCVPGTYQGDWVEAVTGATQVFSTSVSSLQYLIAEAETVLRQELMEHGRNAFERFGEALTAADGPFSLEQEEKSLKAQDTLDSIRLDGGAAMFDAIDDYEFDEFEDTVAAITRWTVEGLGFRPFDANGRAFDARFDPSKAHRLKLTDKHMTRSQMRRWFAGALDRSSSNLPANLQGNTTVVTAGARHRAQAASATLLRVGHPIVSGVQRMLSVDDRGRTFAVRARGTGDGLEPLLRFDFRLEGRLTEDNPTLTRRLEELLPPMYLTIWVDSEGRVLDSEEAQECERTLATPGTESVVGVEAWDAVLEKLEADWPTLVLGLRDVAASKAMADDQWVARLAAAGEGLRSLRTDLEATLRARQSVGQGDTESDLWGREFFFLDQLHETIKGAGPRVEAAGVLFRPSTSGS